MQDQQKEFIRSSLLYNEAKVFYLVESQWWKTFMKGLEDDIILSELGAVRNEGLMEDGGLRMGLMEMVDYELVPDVVWEIVVGWCGGGPEIGRKVLGNGLVEVYPMEIYVIRGDERVVIDVSVEETLKSFRRKVSEVLFVPPHSPYLYINTGDEEWRLIEDVDSTVDDQRIINKTEAYLTMIRNDIPKNTYKNDILNFLEDGEYVVNESSDSEDSLDGYSSLDLLGISSKSRNGNIRGVCGLKNLGNTCFMNSAIQCLSNTPPLTEYFISDEFKNDINWKNPLGTNGKMVNEYAKLLKKMWKGSFTSVSPSDFKWIISKVAPQFSGYRQHDSQELIAYLLDGLHEDLNRIIDKPYIETLESNGINDTQDAVESWKRHQQRNDSLIVDLFQGQYKSTILCPDEECQNVSVTFDPFMYLSVPIPSPKSTLTITFMPLDPGYIPQQYTLEENGIEDVLELKKIISEMIGLPRNHYILANISRHIIFRELTDKMKFSVSNEIFVFQTVPFENIIENESVVYIHSIFPHRAIGDRIIFKNFGTPFVLLIQKNKPISGLELHNLIYAKIKNRLSKEAQSLPLTEIFGLLEFDNNNYHEISIDDEVVSISNPIQWKLAIAWKLETYYNTIYDKQIQRIAPEFEEVSDTITIHDCIQKFLEKETLGKNDEWYCGKCKKHQQATKKFDIWRSPEILIIHLKRFEIMGNSRRKITSFIDFPLSGLDLSEYILSEESKELTPPIYDLYSVSVHGGNLGGGHYTAYAMNHLDKKWYNFNDSSVSQTSRSNVKTNNAYLLFYRRRPASETLFSESSDE